MKFLSMVLLPLLMLSATNSPSVGLPSEPIQLIVAMPKDAVCHSEDMVPLEIAMLNQSDNRVQVDQRRLQITAGFNALIDTENMSFRHEAISSVGDPIEPRTPQVTVIPPKGFLSLGRTVPLPKSLFTQNGFYRMNVTVSVGLSEGEPVSVSQSFVLELRSCQ